MEIMFMLLWLISAPILYWSRYNGPLGLFIVLLIANVICGVLGIALSGKDLGE